MSSQQTCVGPAWSNKKSPSLQLSEGLLNDAIVRAGIRRSFEEYLEIVDRFYADEIVLTSEATKQPVRGKDALRSLLAFSLIPLHIMAEIGGMQAVVHVQPITGDNLNETHAAWTIDLTGVTARLARSNGAASANGKDRASCTNTTMTNRKSAGR